ncbi:MAG: ATP-binding protein [Planctomycetota bacterium]|nr:MAG: ATP-binding protein [Planctomycetota bacterium]
MSDSNVHIKDAVDLHRDRAEIERLSDAILCAAERAGYSKASRFAIRLAFEEAVMNAFHHGHAEKPDEPIRVEYEIDAQQVVMVIEDRGPGFCPDDVPDPTLEENLANPNGRGLMLIRTYMSEVLFNERGNRMTMIYRRPNA